MDARSCYKLFEKSVIDYHKHDDVNHPIENPYAEDSIEATLYHKNWIDTVQWHYEDLIRDPEIEPSEGMKLKRLIDASNQRRTDMVEKIDDYFLEIFKDVTYRSDAKLNTESPAWTLDRLSILALKIYHMQEQADRDDADEALKQKSEMRLTVLMEQKSDLIESFDQLIEDIKNGERIMKVYRQMKLYNDPDTNPVLYSKKA